MADYKQEFGDAVRTALGARSYRQVAAKVGITPSYVGDMVQGRVPSYQIVLKFATATGADAAALLALAGYEPIPPDPTPEDPISTLAGPLRLLDGLDAIQAEFPDFEVTVPRFSGGVRNLTVAEADEWIGLIRAHVIRERELRDAAATSAQPKDKASHPPKAPPRDIGKTR